MRSILAMALVAVATKSAAASPYDVGWSTFHIGLGGPAAVSGSLGERLAGVPCAEHSCALGSRVVLGGGLWRWGVELHLASSPVEDRGAVFPRDRDRGALRGGPMVRFSIARRWGFDVSVRAGVQYGRIGGESSSTSMTVPVACPIERENNCRPETRTTTYEPPAYGMWALSAGVTAQWRVRVEDHGFFGVQVDLDHTVARVTFPDETRSGALGSRTYGITFGGMFDLGR